MKKTLMCAFFLMMLSCLPIYAQQKLGLQDDTFFEAQKPHYQAWLNKHNLSNVIQTDQVFTDTINHTLTLQLMLNYQTADSAIAAYEELRKKFYESNSVPLDNALLYKATQLMEMPASQTLIEILDKANCRKIRIASVNDSIKIDMTACKSVSSSIKVSLNGDVSLAKTVKNMGGMESRENFASFQQNALRKIRTAAEQYYTQKEGKFTFLGAQNGILRFEVSDIQKEILSDGNLMFDKYEYIVITISCVQELSEAKVKYTIDAKSGSSFPWKPRLSAFTPIDADNNGRALLERYALIFGTKLEDWITK